jgi:hypothetical protein
VEEDRVEHNPVFLTYFKTCLQAINLYKFRSKVA